MASTISHYGLLPDPAQEDPIHAHRLLNIEERPFHRILKTLHAPTSILKYPSGNPASLSSRDPNSAIQHDTRRLAHFREAILLEFAALENTIVRIQLIHGSNRRERERYAAEKTRILTAAQAVRDNTVALKARLSDAQAVLQKRKAHDELASKILDDKTLKSREESLAEIERLQKELEDLNAEGAEVESLWAGRREHFDRIVVNGEAMMRLMKGVREDGEGEKDEETMEGVEGTGEGPKAGGSRLGTPGPGGRTPLREDGGDTPMVESGGVSAGASSKPTNKFLEVDEPSRISSGGASPKEPEVTTASSTRIEGDVEDDGAADVVMQEPTYAVDQAVDTETEAATPLANSAKNGDSAAAANTTSDDIVHELMEES